MRITFLGHAGFIVETEQAVVVADPWMSPDGAFGSAWMQFPQNHHLAPLVREKLSTPGKARFLYVSHEHKDHYDPAFLESIERRDFTVVLARFGRSDLRDWFASYGAARVVVCEDGEKLPIPGGYLRVFVEDSGTNRDSALLVRAGGKGFLDLNDCKLHDRLHAIAAEEPRIDVFTAQFSGAIWHPPCYEVDRKTYEAVSRRKVFSKFEAVARSLEILRPRLYVASAGPACFLDPDLMPINFEPVNIFPRAGRFFEFARRRLRGAPVSFLEPMPGDVVDAGTGELLSKGAERVDDETFEAYVRAYAKRSAHLYAARRRNVSRMEVGTIHERLVGELARKLENLAVRERVTVPLYVRLRELPDRPVRVDFAANRVEVVSDVPATSRYLLTVACADLAPVLDGTMLWEDFMLSLRFRASRDPDAYDAVLHGFICLQAEDLPELSRQLLNQERKQERIQVEAGGKLYSINRFCPHQGADLAQGWIEGGRYLVCPRHRWQFDLENGGTCTTSADCVHACGVGDEEREAESQPVAADAPVGPARA